MNEPENTYDPEFEDLQRELRDGPVWRKIFVGVVLPIAALVILSALLSCATPGPLPPLPPVPDISGPPLMAPADGGGG